jgi:hypothetical protein
METLQALENAPMPSLLVIGGLVFLSLALIGRLGVWIDLTKERQKWAGIVGALLLIFGVGLHIVPPAPSPSGGQSAKAEPTPVAQSDTRTLTSTPVPPATTPKPPTDTPLPATATPVPCSLPRDKEVHVRENTRTWPQPDVANASPITTLPVGMSVYIVSDPQWGSIRQDIDYYGWWWQISETRNGRSIGWIWEGRIVECNRK